ncbi:MAG: hypothetical protein RLZZ210_89 [Pseudomonadota bacterium]|jgi:predicted small lipoprotein YifL
MHSYRKILILLGIISLSILSGCGTKGDLDVPPAYQKYYGKK